ncbi:GntR family transcriptional regulator [Marinobacter zhejiangensis]|uniref:Transcriptional regulator, GntR family n=1 Tax=Marinobacter zhejiangensis TaxID=488535 RepID=A0A1I4STC5_9GAMM|nr:GntR family transcriptional regulator [Marinobacter zhejiangensis]SFM67788.1 transcriptional regulator, GntR family [Marinobacter zhejiangensis]
MEFQPPNTLAEQIANYLAQQIMTGTVQPGERIHEARVAATLKVSRASVKEALYILERWHLVDIAPRKGASASQLDAVHATELYDVYMHLLQMLADRLIDTWTEPGLEKVLSNIRLVSQCLNNRGNVLAVVEASFAVMDACCELVGNPYLTEALTNFKPAVSRTYYLSSERYQQDLERTATFFQGLTAAVLSRDKALAADHIKRFGDHQKQLIVEALSIQTPTAPHPKSPA